MNAEAERWLPVVGYEGLYEVSDQGRVKSLPRQAPNGVRGGGMMKSRPRAKGYLCVNLCRNGRKQTHNVHVLVAEAFIGPRPLGFQCCHNNGKPSDNHLGNLRWDTRSGNWADRWLHGTATSGERHGRAKLTENQVKAIRSDPRGRMAIAAEYGVTPQQVTTIKRRLQWAHVP